MTASPRVRYRCSPEHKRHPGSWGQPQWHPREPAISSCPTTIVSDAIPQRWLDAAIAERGCWDPLEGSKYVYWLDAPSGQFFVARRTQEEGAPGQLAEYKGYPIFDHELPDEVVEFLAASGVIDERLLARIRRAKRRRRRQS